jgi:hypothetical protein
MKIFENKSSFGCSPKGRGEGCIEDSPVGGDEPTGDDSLARIAGTILKRTVAQH